MTTKPVFCADCGKQRRPWTLGLHNGYTKPCDCGSFWITLRPADGKK